MEELGSALAELLRAGLRSVAAYREAEAVVTDHRVQAALFRLRLDHERHAHELTQLLRETVGRIPAVLTGPVPGAGSPVHEAIRHGSVKGMDVLDAIRSEERELLELYTSHAERSSAESIRVVLSRHRREEEAHVAWVHESAYWARPV